jgi:hypothetical protein
MLQRQVRSATERHRRTEQQHVRTAEEPTLRASLRVGAAPSSAAGRPSAVNSVPV